MLNLIKNLFGKSESQTHPLDGSTRVAQERADNLSQKVTPSSPAPTNTPKAQALKSKGPTKKPQPQKSRSGKSAPAKKKK